MSADRQSDNQPESPRTTLGDLLYAKPGRRTSEEEWFRLVRSIAAGDEGALRSLYGQSHRIVFTLMFRITNNRETAEELTVDVFYDVWRRASAYDPKDGSVIGWIMNQARSRAIDRVRYEQRKKRAPSAGDRPPSAAANDPAHAYESAEEGLRLRKALEVLTPDERRAIETAYFAELTHQEVAEQLNEPLGTIKTRIRSGLAKLRQALSRKVERI